MMGRLCRIKAKPAPAQMRLGTTSIESLPQ